MKSKWHAFFFIWDLCLFSWALACAFTEKSWIALLSSGALALMAAYAGERAWRELLDAVRGDDATDTDHNSK